MARFRKRPVEIEAIPVQALLYAAANDWDQLPGWIMEAYELGEIVFLVNSMVITTLEGEMVGKFDDWIIRGVKGEVYPCNADVFAATYDIVGA